MKSVNMHVTQMAKAFPVAKIIKNLVAIGIPQCLSNCCWVPRVWTEKLRQKKANDYITGGLKSTFSTADFKKWLEFMRMSLLFYSFSLIKLSAPLIIHINS